MLTCMELEYSASSNLAARKGLWVRIPPSAQMEKLVVHCKKEKFDVYIGRPSKWGNPFSHNPKSTAEVKVDSREEAIACYEEYLRENPKLVAEAKQELKGKILGCWCHPQACHGNVLATVANE